MPPSDERRRMLTAAVASDKSEAFFVGRHTSFSIHAIFSATGSVDLLVSNKGDADPATAADWVKLDTFTANGILYLDVPVVCVMLEVDSGTTGTVDAYMIMAG